MICFGIKGIIPFSTAHLFAQPLRLLSDDLGKYHLLSGNGGTCNTINPFTKALLGHIGYKVIDVVGSTCEDEDINDHISNIVCDVSFPGSKHLLEVGSRHSLLQTIPLNFEKESPIYVFNNMAHKFVKENKSVKWYIRSDQRDTSMQQERNNVNKGNGKWKFAIQYGLEKPNGRYLFNKYSQSVVNGQRIVSPGIRIFVFNINIQEKHINVFASKERIEVITTMKHGRNDKVDMNSEELGEFFKQHFPSFSQRLLQKIVRSNYQYEL